MKLLSTTLVFPVAMVANTNGRAYQDKIDHFVVLFMENHSADQIFGCLDLPGFDGIPQGGHKIPKSPLVPSLGFLNVSCGTADYICTKGPTYDKFGHKFKPSDEIAKFPPDPCFYPYGGPDAQDDKYSYAHGLEGFIDSEVAATRMYSAAQLPIKAALAKSYGVFNKMYTSVPGPSSPNHLFAQSGTSCGMRDNKLWNDCGGSNVSFPQRTIYDAMREHGVSFGFYMNSTCGLDGHPACHGEDPITPDSPSAISTPDVAMEGVARYSERFFSQKFFYEGAASGTLPAFSWFLPPIQACDHPCHDVAKGERLLKDVYEALRASPKWNRTLLLVAYDDTGGYYDHVVPPFEGVPADESPCHLQNVCGLDWPFDFRRLGLRSAAMLISPWVEKGAVFQEPKKGPMNTSQFELTSIAATVKNLFNLSSFLTKRDAWAGNFEELLLNSSRTELDTPMHLPEPPPAAAPWDPPDNGTLPGPGHCSSWDGGKEEDCVGPSQANLKQKRNIRLLAGLTGRKSPLSSSELELEVEVEKMTVPEANRQWKLLWGEWLRQQREAKKLEV